jgi:hypothetical protein
VDDSCFETFSAKLFCCTVSSVACPSEHHRFPCSPDQVHRYVDSFASVNSPEMMLKELNVGGFWSHFVTDRVALVVAGKRSDVFVEGRRKQQGLSVRRSEIQYASYVRQKTHVGHAVCFVDHYSPRRFKGQRFAVEEILKTSWAGDEHVDAFVESVDLAFDVGATVRGQHPQVVCLGKRS